MRKSSQAGTACLNMLSQNLVRNQRRRKGD